ncbi:hypothetical protein VQ042_05640 [Aurantimonas sp. A2-1-M11]|uniref:hypothetical protein n=1 Tax=Aurantimonas sp. A2-1-M11 TaxID=3113712 RepID=UPI002F92AB24
MISLAQYLPELDADSEMPARRMTQAREETSFEPLVLVAANQPAPAAKPRLSPIPEMEVEDEETGADLDFASQFAHGTAGEAPAAAGMLPHFADLDDATRDDAAGGLADLGDFAAPDFGSDAAMTGGDEDDAFQPADVVDPLEAAREAGIQQGRAEAEAEAAAALAAASEAAEAAKAAAIEAARGEWAGEEGEQIGSLLSERLDRIETIVRASLSSVLKPIALGARRRQTVLELADAVGMLIGDGEALSIRVSGPADLLEALEEALGKRKSFIICEPDPDMVEVRIECDQTVVETRLKGWRTALEEALA